MADLKPLGSERLNGDDKLKRILELTYYKENNKKSSINKPELVKESTTGGVFGIVKEKDGYFVKRGLNESSLDYIGGIFMRNKNKFSSYAEAYKRLDLLKGQEELQEATKYVLKPTAPKQEAPAAEPSLDAPAPDAGMDVPSPDGVADAPTPEASADAPSGDMGVDTSSPDAGMDGELDANGEPKRSDYMAEIQKYAGKLGQELRDQHQKMESDDIKYVLNMVISACDLDKLDDEDIEEIGKKFEREEDELGQEGGEEVGSEEPTGEEPAAEPTPDETEMGESSMDALERFVNTPMDTHEVSLSDHMDQSDSMDGEYSDDTHELDLDAIKTDISQAIGDTLSKYFKH
jgi:hypothetical protein